MYMEASAKYAILDGKRVRKGGKMVARDAKRKRRREGNTKEGERRPGTWRTGEERMIAIRTR